MEFHQAVLQVEAASFVAISFCFCLPNPMITNPLWPSEIMHEFLKEDIINVKSWFDVGDCNYEHDHKDETTPESGIVYCNIEHIHEFFRKCEYTDNKYVVVSGFSDFGITYQQEHPVAIDMVKTLPFIKQHIPEIGYEDLRVRSRCDRERCDENHTYSIKSYAWTYSTIKSIPSNVIKWFTVNSLVEQPRIQGIPFGIGKDATEDILQAKKYNSEEKTNLLYINWEDRTNIERIQLKSYFYSADFDWVTLVQEPLDFKQYLEQLSSHKYCLCPEGNGIDTYRFLECIYMGTIPIVFDSPAMRYLSDLPILIVKTLDDLSYDNLMSNYDSLINKATEESMRKAKMSYWKDEINKAAELIHG